MIKRLFARKPEPRLRVLMVCMGNICRSPMAEGALRRLLQAEGLDAQVMVDSAGTLGAHRGAPPDPRAVACAAQRGLDIQGLRARQVNDADFERFDLLLALDQSNLDALLARCPPPLHGRLALLLQHNDERPEREVPDPYYGSTAAFEAALDLIEAGCRAWLPELRRRALDGPDTPR